MKPRHYDVIRLLPDGTEQLVATRPVADSKMAWEVRNKVREARKAHRETCWMVRRVAP